MHAGVKPFIQNPYYLQGSFCDYLSTSLLTNLEIISFVLLVDSSSFYGAEIQSFLYLLTISRINLYQTNALVINMFTSRNR